MLARLRSALCALAVVALFTPALSFPAKAQDLIYDINPGPGSSFLSDFAELNGQLYFEADDGTNGFELWRTDGTAVGTALVKDINPGSGSSLESEFVELFAELNGQLYFEADDGTNGFELWRTDGTAAGTALVKDINPGSGSSSLSGFTALDGALYFNANDGTNGFELWRTDGTAAGTVLVKDINPGSESSTPLGTPIFFAELNGQLYFQANDGTSGRELWRTDGTEAGTVLVKDINPGSGDGFPSLITALDGALYFRANDGTNGIELWRTDGTAAGTALVKDINPGSVSSFLGEFTALDGALYFNANDGTSGRELWRTDGTAAGTVLVADVRVGPEGSVPDELTAFDGALYFNADDGTSGRELWRYAPGQAASCAFSVTTNSDSGSGSLRQAILDANASAGAETICFDIPGTGPHTIQPTSALPQITDPVTIDGLTQPGAACDSWPATLQVELDGSQTSAGTDGLGVSAAGSGSTIRGLVINRFTRNGVGLFSADNNTLACNYVGTNVAGTAALPNGNATGGSFLGDGVFLGSSSNNVIGGEAATGVRNLLSGNAGSGISAGSGSTGSVQNRILGNFIGTNASGDAAIGNGEFGIRLGDAPSTEVGGMNHDAGVCNRACNLIAGNGLTGLLLNAAGGATVQGNFIGTRRDGLAAIGNGFAGINVFAPDNQIGGTSAEARNIVSGNALAGIVLQTVNATGNVIEGNYAGLGADGTTPVPNVSSSNGKGDGVILNNAPSNTIGGTAAGAGNVIASNGGDGILITDGATGTTVQGNLIGTDGSGLLPRGNTFSGIAIFSGQHTIGGATAVARNVIADNGVFGVAVEGGSGTVIQGNYIGLGADGATPLGNRGTTIGGTGDGVFIKDATGTEVLGNTISGNADDGVQLSNATSTTVQDNRIGTNAAGTAAAPNADGVDLGASASNVVADNLLSGNTGSGIDMEDSSDNTITGNLIGLDVTGTSALGNGVDGIFIGGGSTNNQIGGTAAGDGNTISANGLIGIEIEGGSTSGNVVQGNRIGANAAGTVALGNGEDGVLIEGAPSNTIGGAVPDAGNLISGNGDDGIDVFASGSTGTLIQHNYIGTDAAGTGALGNLEDGIDINNDASNTEVYDNVVSANAEIGVRIALGAANNVVSRNFIGTNASGDNLGNGGHGVLALDSGPQVIGGACCEGNTIAFNGGNGVTIQALASISFDKGILGNRIFQNGGLGIDLQDDGITLNDPGDGDGESSANKLQNYPDFFTTDYDATANEITVSYAVDSDPALTTAGASTYPLRIEFFRADADGEEGAAFLGTDAYTEADYDGCVPSGGTAPCPKAITFTPAASVTAADFILATATDATGNTSEFSESGQPLPVELTAFTATLDGGSVRLAWKTATETNNAGFEVERTIGEGWQALAFVAGAGTTSQPQSYRFVDAAVPFEAEGLTYRLRQVDTDGAVEHSPEVEVALGAPEAFALEPVFPNPLRGQATFRYALPQAGPVRLAVYDVLGRQVAVLVDGEQPAGRHAVAFDAGRLPSGLYLARLTGAGASQIQRLTVVQ